MKSNSHLIRILSMSLVVASLAIISACSKNDSSLPAPGNPAAKKLIKIEEGQNSSSFEYNPDGTLKKIVTIDDDGYGAEQYSVSFIYNGGKEISEAIFGEGGKLKFFYEGSRLKLIDRYNIHGEKSAYHEYAWTGNSLGTLTTWSYDYPGQGNQTPFVPVFKLDYTYHANGNLKQVKAYARNPLLGMLQLSGTETFDDYDNKINPLSALAVYAMSTTEIVGRHNHTRKVRLNENNQVVETILTTYQYDQDGYPVSSVEKHMPLGLLPFYLNYKYTYE